MGKIMFRACYPQSFGVCSRSSTSQVSSASELLLLNLAFRTELRVSFLDFSIQLALSRDLWGRFYGSCFSLLFGQCMELRGRFTEQLVDMQTKRLHLKPLLGAQYTKFYVKTAPQESKLRRLKGI